MANIIKITLLLAVYACNMEAPAPYNENLALNIESDQSIDIVEGELVELDIKIEKQERSYEQDKLVGDSSDDLFTMSCEGCPEWVRIDNEEKKMWAEPGYDAAGVYRVNIS